MTVENASTTGDNKGNSQQLVESGALKFVEQKPLTPKRTKEVAKRIGDFLRGVLNSQS